MLVSGSFTFDDGSTIEVDISDAPLENFDPLRLADMTRELRDTLRAVISDALHTAAEHQPADD